MVVEDCPFRSLRCVAVLVIGVYNARVLSQTQSSKAVNWLQYLLPQNYVNFHSPSDDFHGDKPVVTRIGLSFIPRSLMNVEPKTMDFAVDFELSIQWIDGRLNVPKEELDLSSYLVDVPKGIAAKLWTPYIVLYNCKRCKHNLMDSTQQRFRLFSWRKKISVVIETSYTFSCDIDLANYPFDQQNCSIIIEKYENRQKVPFVSSDNEVEMDPKLVNSPPEFSLISVKAKNCTNSSALNDECVKIMFHLRRQYTHHIMLVFTPSMLIVVLSWISFWLDPDVTAPRVALGLTTLLTLATQFNSAQKDLPPVAKVKALDIWMFVCMFMVFSSLIEFALSNYWHRRRMRNLVEQMPFRNRNLIKDQRNSSLQGRLRKFSPDDEDYVGSVTTKTTCIDLTARIVFPAVFVIFNIFYWFYFTNVKANK